MVSWAGWKYKIAYNVICDNAAIDLLEIANGTSSNPSFTFLDNNAVGFYKSGSEIGVASGGGISCAFGLNFIRVNSLVARNTTGISLTGNDTDGADAISCISRSMYNLTNDEARLHAFRKYYEDDSECAAVMINGLKLAELANYGGGIEERVKTTQTISTTPNDIWVSNALEDDETYEVEANIIGMENDGSDRALYVIRGLFYRNGGNVSQQGATSKPTEIESNANWDASFTLDTTAQTIKITVVGDTGETVNWKADIKFKKLTTS